MNDILRKVIISVLLSTVTALLRPIFQVVWLTWKNVWWSNYVSWGSRAPLVPEGTFPTFTPSQDNLVLAVLFNAPAEPEGITLALFAHPRKESDGSDVLAINSLGHLRYVKSADAVGLLNLARTAQYLQPTQGSRNTWIIKHPTTSQPIHRLFFWPFGNKPRDVSVQGFTKESRELLRTDQGAKELPRPLWELVGLVLEARQEGHEEIRDEAMLAKVREIVKPLF